MANKIVHLPVAPLGETLRKDAWWVGPLATVAVLSGFIVYATLRAFEGSALRVGRVPLAVLLAVLRRRVGEEAGLDVPHAGDAHPAGPRELPLHLLLLPQGLLPRLRVGPARVRSRRARCAPLQRRDEAPHLPEPASLRDVRRASSSSSSSGRTRSSASSAGGTACTSGSARSSCSPTCMLLTGYTFGCHCFRHLIGGSVEQLLDGGARRAALQALEARHRAQRAPHGVRVDEPLRRSRSPTSTFAWSRRGPDRRPVVLGRRGHFPSRCHDGVERDEVRDARARRARHRRRRRGSSRGDRGVSAMGLRVGLVCKSLLGKAHTVMAEGGVAAALGNVEPKDNWKVHFRDTMKGGRYLNQWRMAQLHAMEAPDRVKELEEWGALFDRTADGRILQRNFGGHKYPRLAHVGDRTGLEMIRTLQQHGIHRGMQVYMECTVTRLLGDGDRDPRRVRLLARERPLRHLRREGRRPRDRRHRPRVQDQLELVGVHRATGRRSRTSPAPSSWTWSSCSSTRRAWCGRPSVRGTLDHRRRARRGRHAPEQGRQAHHVRLHPRALRERDGDHRGRGRSVARGEHQRASRRRRSARRISCRATSSRARSTPR